MWQYARDEVIVSAKLQKRQLFPRQTGAPQVVSSENIDVTRGNVFLENLPAVTIVRDAFLDTWERTKENAKLRP